MPDSHDAYAPPEIARRVRDIGVKKARLPIGKLLVLSVLAGAFIGLGAAFSTVAVTGLDLGFGLRRAVSGLTFCLGLILVVVAGAELFTGNNLIVMARASGLISTSALLRNWGLAYVGNLIGSVATALIVFLTGTWAFADYGVGATAVQIAASKCGLGFVPAFFRGVLGNALVCLAVWLCFSARTTTDKILAILFPITAFVALGFEHSIANMYFIPMGILLERQPEVLAAGGIAGSTLEALSVTGFVRNLVPVTLGNMVGGGLFVGLVYWLAYLRDRDARSG